MKIPRILRRKKLRATTAARRSLRASAEMGYDDLSEPNMKLSRALLIVLLLHIVAVSGIVAFNAIKSRQGSFVKAALGKKTLAVRQNIQPPTNSPVRSEQSKQNTRVSRVVPSTTEKPKGAETAVKASERDSKPVDSGKVYVVVKGDNPVTIAKKFKVAYDDLMELNHIEDPRKLQIGTKLSIPESVKQRKAGE